MEVRINRRSGVMHLYPASEACNLDQAMQEAAASSPTEGRKHRYYKRDCKRCFDPEQG